LHEGEGKVKYKLEGPHRSVPPCLTLFKHIMLVDLHQLAQRSIGPLDPRPDRGRPTVPWLVGRHRATP